MTALRYLIFSDIRGVYLGSFAGLGFWSGLDPAGQDAAVTFNSEETILKQIRDWGVTSLHGLRSVPVEVAGDHATVAECVAAGLEPWDPFSGPSDPYGLPVTFEPAGSPASRDDPPRPIRGSEPAHAR